MEQIKLNYTPEEVLVELDRFAKGGERLNDKVIADLKVMVELVGRCVKRVD